MKCSPASKSFDQVQDIGHGSTSKTTNLKLKIRQLQAFSMWMQPRFPSRTPNRNAKDETSIGQNRRKGTLIAVHCALGQRPSGRQILLTGNRVDFIKQNRSSIRNQTHTLLAQEERATNIKCQTIYVAQGVLCKAPLEYLEYLYTCIVSIYLWLYTSMILNESNVIISLTPLLCMYKKHYAQAT